MVGITGFTLGSLDLRTLAINISSPNGWDVMPDWKNPGTEYAFTHGEALPQRVFYKAREIDMNLVLMATGPTGLVTTSPAEHLQENIDLLMQACHNTFQPIPLVRTMPDASQRTALVRTARMARFDEGPGKLSRVVNVTFLMHYPFWHGAIDTQTINSTTEAVITDGTAPVNDMVITFIGAGRITHVASGDYIESDTAGAVVDVGRGTITGADQRDIHSNVPWWFQLEPGGQNVTTTGNIKIDWYHGYF